MKKNRRILFQIRLDGTGAMAITVSVRVASELVPVIGMNLKRTGGTRQSALSR